MRQNLIFLFSVLPLLSYHSTAQISPPGLGDSRLAFWSAFAIKQDLDTSGHKQLVLYTGLGRMSSPDNADLFSKQGIAILNAEFYNRFTNSFQYSLALSYRIQHEYANDAPFEKEDPAFRQEFRFYTRLAHQFEANQFKWVNTLRTDYRIFFDPQFTFWNEDFQFRIRYRTQFTFPLDSANRNRITLSAEPLFSISHNHAMKQWGTMNYRESRLCLYFSHRFKNAPLTLNIGYMNNLIKNKSVSYLGIDLIWNNPFRN